MLHAFYSHNFGLIHNTTGSPTTICWLTGYWALSPSLVWAKRIPYLTQDLLCALPFSDNSNSDNQENEPTPDPTPNVTPKVDIFLVNTVAYVWACKLPGTQEFTLNLKDITAQSTSISNSPLVDLSSVPEEYHNFVDVFNKAKADTLAPHQCYGLKINLEEGSTPPLRLMYFLSQTKLTTLWEFIDEHLAAGFVWPSQSPHGTPVLFTKKKDGGLHLCINFCGLNEITKKDCYPLPLIMDLLDSPGRAWIYTKIDLQHAYHLVHIAKDDEWKTAFWTQYGSFEWLVMPFGLTNSPATFQGPMNVIFSEMLDVCIIIYLNDILIYSNNKELHQKPDCIKSFKNWFR